MVPEGWSEGKVSDLLVGLESGVSVNGEDRKIEPNEMAVLKVSAVSYGFFDPTAAKVVDGEELERAKTNPKHGQIIISRSNTEELVGASAYIDADHPNLFLPDKLWQTIPKPNSDMKWLSYVLASDHSRYMLSNLSTGTSGSMKNITKGELLGLKVLIPPAIEQNKIAQILSSWDKAITTTEQLLANSQQQKKALMQQLLTGKKRLLDKNGVRFSGEWKSNHLKKLLQISKGNQLNKDTLSKSGEYAVINGGIEPSGYTSEYNTEANTITISEGGNSCGFVGFQPTRFWCGGHCYAIKNLKIDLNFTYQLLKFNQSKIMRLRVGSGLPNIQKKDLEALSVDYPISQEEQRKIAAVLSTADQEITALQQKLAALKQEKKALMQQLLTGKRRVTLN
ncbi:restriction endonuclease subunit S [Venatoribacter cucullus]|uniref:restriction endonuclease subunit S n=1 Tax=Venatoribacter cucullus TaxID=2661630 RepID=UPI00223EB171|nr:restriction endonuclease subunit S [Venatoribacter cucullus]UZK03880.1 restriction endonuclease subunit S [Venatoribacter cucullus]